MEHATDRAHRERYRDPFDNIGTSLTSSSTLNVERIRPRSLEPFDFEEANSGRAWFAEGFTSYYDELTLKRLITDLDGYARYRRLARRHRERPGTPSSPSDERAGRSST
jgi:hypothetical protein